MEKDDDILGKEFGRKGDKNNETNLPQEKNGIRFMYDTIMGSIWRTGARRAG